MHEDDKNKGYHKSDDDLLNKKYKLIRELGNGTSSEVALYKDVNLDIKVAIKKSKLPKDKDFKNLYIKEARRLAKLEHRFLPHVYEVFDVAGYHYMVMSYKSMDTLQDYCKELNDSSKKEFVDISLKTIFLNILEVVSYIHHQKVMHLDIKPDNILIDTNNLNIRLLDFELSRSFESDATSYVLEGSKYATHSYSAPEILEQTNISHLADIYSLGAVLYNLSHNFKKPPRIPNKNKFNLFTDVLLKCMEEEPQDRFLNVDELRVGFSKLFDGTNYTVDDFTKREPDNLNKSFDENNQTMKDMLKVSNIELDNLSKYLDDLNSKQIKVFEGIEFSYIKAGEFMMGSPKELIEAEKAYFKSQNVSNMNPILNSEGPQHKIKISKDFYMQTTQVTQKQWFDVMETKPSYFKGDNRPVECVSFDDIRDFLKEINERVGFKGLDVISVIDNGNLSKLPSGCFRLPTESEWEYCCRAGTNSIFSFGDSLDSSQANFDGNEPYGDGEVGINLGETCDVGLYKKNAFGLYDMHGNVWEKVQDWHDMSFYSKNFFNVDTVNVKKASLRVNKGGAWNLEACRLRSSIRGYGDLDELNDVVGFRLLVVR
ncbi:MAG: hypothetical protein COB02_04790 [Candidatus Cloacimonadota bacterium]|nr:MAG: hypothetical protein COB02_04790 [Candidatus Cloacimonadota bacterium]